MTSASDKDWKAESDLNALIEAEKIKLDNVRMAAAMKKKKELKKSLEKLD